MASVAFSTGLTGSQVSQSGHRPENNKDRETTTTTTHHTHTHSRTRGTAVHQCSQCLPVPPVVAEVVDGHVGELVLDPAEQPLLRGLGLQLRGNQNRQSVSRLFFPVFESRVNKSWRGYVLVVVALPDGHGDGVVQDQSPDQTQDQLQVPVHDGFGV